jgi:hypothetical protein
VQTNHSLDFEKKLKSKEPHRPVLMLLDLWRNS